MKGDPRSSVQSIETRRTEAALPDERIDKLLHAAYLAGDDSAFDRIVERHHERIARLAYRLVGWQGDIEDIVQDVFLTVLKKLKSFRGESSLSTWLTTITINRCRTYQRRQLLRLRWWRSQQSSTPPYSADSNPFDSESNERVRQAVRSLPPKDREVIVLFYLEERSSAEIAKLLNTTTNAVDVRLHRARQKLKPLLKDWVEV